jgi:hypothetical protein
MPIENFTAAGLPFFCLAVATDLAVSFSCAKQVLIKNTVNANTKNFFVPLGQFRIYTFL